MIINNREKSLNVIYYLINIYTYINVKLYYNIIEEKSYQ